MYIDVVTSFLLANVRRGCFFFFSLREIYTAPSSTSRFSSSRDGREICEKKVCCDNLLLGHVSTLDTVCPKPLFLTLNVLPAFRLS